MTDKNDDMKKAVPDSSVGADEEQPDTNNCKKIISENFPNSNDYFLKSISLNELLDTTYPPKLPVIKGFLHAGTYIFVGPPKIGKSFLMAQIGFHVSNGLDLWGYETRKGKVLYLALEDDYSRLQQRLVRMFGEDGCDDLFFVIDSLSLKQGLIAQLEEFIKNNPDLSLIIIDTLQKIRESQYDRYSYGNDYDVMSRLKQLSDQSNVCILVVHHTRKMEAADSFDLISGTNGIFGAADGAFVLQKANRTDQIATLEITGRDQPDEKLELKFDPDRCIWNLEKRLQKFPEKLPDPVLLAISKLVDGGQWEGSPSDLFEEIHCEMKSPNSLSRYLNVHNSDLYFEYSILMDSGRNHDGRYINLHYIKM